MIWLKRSAFALLGIDAAFAAWWCGNWADYYGNERLLGLLSAFGFFVCICLFVLALCATLLVGVLSVPPPPPTSPPIPDRRVRL